MLRAVTTVLASTDVFATRSGVAAGDWDAALLALGGHFLQSTAWQRVQEALGYPVVHARDAEWMWSASLRLGRFPRYMYVPYGPTVRAGADDAARSMVAAARGNALDFVRAEPDSQQSLKALRGIGSRRARSIQPSATWVLDIDAPEDALRRGLSSGHRGSINAAERRGLRFASTRDPRRIDVFLDLQRRSVARSGYEGRPARYHRTVAQLLMPGGAATLYLAEAGESAVAAALCFDFGVTRYYAHAASDPALGRRLGAAAPLVWAMIMDARAKGLEHFDFWGVVPHAQPGHPWAGFTQFKMSFGGRLVQRVGTWDVPVRHTRYLVYSALARARR